jgi:ribokinase
MTTRPRLAVLGSLNMDISVSVGRLPGPGETILGGQAVIAPGGKGANQAVAAARLGAGTTMSGCVGEDEFGGPVLLALAAEGIETKGVRRLPGVATGLALITVSADGENMITVAPGANGECGPAEAAAALAGPPDLLVISAEIPPAAIAAALAAAASRGVPTLLNLAPVPANAAALLAAGVDWLVVNESEAAALLGRPVPGLAGAAEVAAALRDLLPASAGQGTEAPAALRGLLPASAGLGTEAPAAARGGYGWSPPDRTARRWPARTAPRRCPGLRWPAWMPWGRVTRSWPRWRWAWRRAPRRRKRCARPAPPGPPRPPGGGPRRRCPGPPTSRPPPV